MRRSKNVRKPVPRPQDSSGAEIRAEIRQRFADDWAWLDLFFPENFYKVLPTTEERAAFAEIFPREFYDLFGFESNSYDAYPASVINVDGCCVFRREHFVDLMKENPPRFPFPPPNLTAVRYRDRQVTMARARMEWWRSNQWPTSKAEDEFILFGGPRDQETRTEAAIEISQTKEPPPQ